VVDVNKSETKAYNWLLKQGYSKQDIVFQYRENPSFLTSDERGYEAKRLYANTIWFTPHQFSELRKMKNTTILVFPDDCEEPILRFPSLELREGVIGGGIKVKVAKMERFEFRVTVSLPEHLAKWLDELVGQGAFSSISDGVCRCVALAKKHMSESKIDLKEEEY
jgi:hypothetical protein